MAGTSAAMAVTSVKNVTSLSLTSILCSGTASTSTECATTSAQAAAKATAPIWTSFFTLKVVHAPLARVQTTPSGICVVKSTSSLVASASFSLGFHRYPAPIPMRLVAVCSVRTACEYSRGFRPFASTCQPTRNAAAAELFLACSLARSQRQCRSSCSTAPACAALYKLRRTASMSLQEATWARACTVRTKKRRSATRFGGLPWIRRRGAMPWEDCSS
mmetsp:Transcript_37578/g.120794  ORF Transcript_37578/g.120794 Transcript_37578/m.120794 type:complete len:218 (-) Transcript_37578:222-875(-)